MMGLSQAQISRYESGASKVSYKLAMQMMHTYCGNQFFSDGEGFPPSAWSLANRIETETEGKEKARLRGIISDLLDAWIEASKAEP